MKHRVFPYTLTKDEEKGLMTFEADHLCRVVLMSNRYARYQGKDKIEVPLFKGKVKLITTDHNYMYLSTVDKAVPTVSLPSLEVKNEDPDPDPEIVDNTTSEVTEDSDPEVNMSTGSKTEESPEVTDPEEIAPSKDAKSGKKKKK